MFGIDEDERKVSTGVVELKLSVLDLPLQPFSGWLYLQDQNKVSPPVERGSHMPLAAGRPRRPQQPPPRRSLGDEKKRPVPHSGKLCLLHEMKMLSPLFPAPTTKPSDALLLEGFCWGGAPALKGVIADRGRAAGLPL